MTNKKVTKTIANIQKALAEEYINTEDMDAIVKQVQSEWIDPLHERIVELEGILGEEGVVRHEIERIKERLNEQHLSEHERKPKSVGDSIIIGVNMLLEQFPFYVAMAFASAWLTYYYGPEMLKTIGRFYDFF